MGWDKLYIYWKGELVGELLKPIPDMWYLEGTFKPYQGQGAKAFENIARKLDPKTIFTNHQMGGRIEYSSYKEPDVKRYPAIVLSLDNNNLVIRRMSEK